MAVSDAYKALLSAETWASSDAAFRTPPEDSGIDPEDGWDASHEQLGSGRYPTRGTFNWLFWLLFSALKDIAATGIPAWDSQVDYRPTADARSFVVTPTQIWWTDQETGPGFGNATDPDTPNQEIWRPY